MALPMSRTSGSLVFLACLLCLYHLPSVLGCGITTHMVIADTARNHYRQITDNHDYRKILDKHNDAFMGGAPFPDSFYSDLCFAGMYHNISEDTHWTPFLNATINYINKQPKPWNNATEKLVAFMMGVMSHQVADVLWHSLGIDQGFLTTMGYVNFHGSYPKAHQAGDLGGDIVGDYSYYFSDYIDPYDNWYMPVDDLYNIYNELYGTTVIDKETIETCSTLMLVGAIAEVFASAELFQDVADTSPFLVDNMQSYFLGGLEDMAGWSFEKWHEAANMLENGTSACRLPHNPLYINCTKPAEPFVRRSEREEVNGHFIPPRMNGLTIKDMDIERSHRGIMVKPGEHLRNKLTEMKVLKQIKQKKFKELQDKKKVTENMFKLMYNVNQTGAFLGWGLVKGDFDQDGNEDLAIGAPFYGEDENPYMGRVFIVYNSLNGLKPSRYLYLPINLNNLTLGYNRILSGFPQKRSRFGFSLAVVDLNQDGLPDLAVGAPSYSVDDPLAYQGVVYIYFSQGESRTWSTPNVTVTCQAMYCNLGYSLSTADVTGDGHEDLIIGSPYWSSSKNMQQNGFIVALPSDKTYSGPMTVAMETLKWRQEGDQPYSWYGYSLHSRGGVLFVDQPYYRKCQDPSKFSEDDIQSIGKLHIMNFGTKYAVPKNFTLEGVNKFDMIGESSDVGDPFGNGTLTLAVGVPGANVNGIILTLPWKLSQGGAVHLYQIGSDGQMTMIAKYESDRRYARFGSLVMFEDLNKDGIDDLVISSPFRNDDPTDIFNLIFNGKTYGFYGGKNFTLGDVTNSTRCDIVSPCPEEVADVHFDAYEDEDISYFGDHAVVLRAKNNTQMVIAAARNTDEDWTPWYTESGKVYIWTL